METPIDYSEMSEAELCRQDFIAYCIAQYPSFVFPKHILLMAIYLEKVANGEIKRLLITMPPRHGKSETASKLFPAWFIGKHKGKKTVAIATYGQDLSNEIGVALNGRMNSDVYKEIFPESVPSDASNSIKRLVTVNGGGYIATAVGGALTGKGGHLRILDDPNKNREEAESDLEQKKQWDWWTSVFMTRGEVEIRDDGESAGDDEAPTIVILTRWSDKDIARKLIDLQKEQNEAGLPVDQWVELNLEAICTKEDDPLGRTPCENIEDPLTWKDENALWPEKVSASMLARLRWTIGPRDFNSLFQQTPSSATGDLFLREMWQFYQEVPPECDRPVQSWDCNYKQTSDSDFAVGLIARARKKRSLYIMDRWKGRWPFPVLLEKVRAAKELYPETTAIYIEEKANGRPVIDTLSLEIAGIIPVEPKILGSKDARWNGSAKYQNAGNIYLPLNAPWVPDFIEAMSAIPGGKYDDDADAFAQLVLMSLGQPSSDGLIRHVEKMLAEDGIDLAKMELDSNDPFNTVYGNDAIANPLLIVDIN
jgi:predicted phage terminase large subunit-like protein